MNEIPSGLCSAPIVMGIQTSIGAVIAVLNGKDPDNENVINDDPSNKSLVIRNKQQLSHSLSPEQNSWPFRIKTNSLFKSGVSVVLKFASISHLKLFIFKSQTQGCVLSKIMGAQHKCFVLELSSLSSVIIHASVVLKRTVGDSDLHFNNLSGSHLQSQSNIAWSVDGIYCLWLLT